MHLLRRVPALTSGVRASLGWTALYAAAVLLGRAARVDDSQISVVWPAAGVGTAWLLSTRAGGRAVALLLLAAVTTLVNAATGADLVASLLFGPVNAAHAVLAAAVLRAGGWRHVRPAHRLQDVAVLAAASVAGAAASAAGGAAVAAWRYDLPVLEGLPLLLSRNAVSTFVVAVALLSLLGKDQSPAAHGPAQGTERVAVVTLTLLSPLGLLLVGQLPLGFLLIPFTILAAVRLGASTTALLVGAQAVPVVLATLNGTGPFGAVESVAHRVLVAQTFVMVLILLGLCLAVVERERAEALARSAADHAALQAHLDAALVGQASLLVQADGTACPLALNPALRELLGRPLDDLTRTPWLDCVEPASSTSHQQVLGDLAAGRLTEWHGELQLRTPDGPTWAEAVLAVVEATDGGVVVTAQFLDVSARKEAETRLSHLALHDELTGLPKRTLWQDRVTVALARASRTGARVAVLYLDLDRFKEVNDDHGHAVGDELLVWVGARLRQVVRPEDTVARTGGDEFVVVCPDVRGPSDVEEICGRLLGALTVEVPLSGVALPLSVSIGSTVSQPGEDDVRVLLREADAALYVAKAQGRGRAAAYTAQEGSAATSRARLLGELRQAVERDELVLHYQPVMDLTTGRPQGVEALVRWQHPVRGLLGPAEFLDVLESSDLVHPVGKSIVQQAVRDAAALRTAPTGPLVVHVNVSAEQLGRPELPAVVGEALAECGLPGTLLTLEVTETRLLAVSPALLEGLAAVRELGVQLAADDFGTGYSTLTHLVQLPVDTLKVDRSFVAGLGTDPRADAVTAGILAMAGALGLSCVAEGVEEPAQAEALVALGCTAAQGYLWARPMPLEELRAWLAGAGAVLPRPRSATDDRTATPAS